MENQVFPIAANEILKNLLLQGNNIWISKRKIDDIDKIKAEINSGKNSKKIYSIPLSSISKVAFNTVSQTTDIHFLNEKGKEKKVEIQFQENASQSKLFAQLLGDKLEFKMSTAKERKIRPFLSKGLYLIFVIAFTLYLGMMDDTATLTDGTGGRNRGKAQFLKLIVDTLGQTGVFLVGGLIALNIIYKSYKEYQNPPLEIIYTK